MKSTRILTILVMVLGLILCQAEVCEAEPMGTAFTYQGRLIDANSAADGLYDFQFKLFNDPCTGAQQGSTIDINDLDVIDGYFTAELDFGSDVFDGDARWLEIGIRPGEMNDPNAYLPLSPRQEVTPVPYALQTRGMFVDNASNVGIGTTSPAAKLSVNGAILRSGSTMYGPNADTHINLGTSSTTGLSGQDRSYTTVGGGKQNTASGPTATVGGGWSNTASSWYTTVSGGEQNRASGYDSTVGGGLSNTASGSYATISGGEYSTASGLHSTVPGGYNNIASGTSSFAAGRRAKANHDGAFVWADSTDAAFASTGNDQFLIRASGGVGIGTASPGAKLDVAGNIGVSGTVDGVDLSAHATNTTAHHTPPTTLPPSGPAGGDLSATYPNPSVLNDSHTHGNGTVSDSISINNGRLYAPAGSGNVGIGTTSPTQKLDVAGEVTASSFRDRDDPSLSLDPTSMSALVDLRVYDDLDVYSSLYVEGPVKMPSVYVLSVFGRDVKINSSGDLGTLLSSRRYKENIAPLEDDFTKILEAQPVAFTWKESKEPDIGLIAEDIDELGLRNLVFYDAQGRPESVRYDFVSLYLLEVLKDQARSITELKGENELLKEQLNAQNQSVKQKLDALEKTIQQLTKAKEVQL